MKIDMPCEHCGADCGKSPIIWNNKSFCCNGCKQVYQILNENQLSQYYKFEEMPGIKIESTGHSDKYAFLDNDEIKEKLYRFHEGNIAKVEFQVPVIHCASCIWLLERLNKLNAGIKNSSVNFISKNISITFNSNEISLRQVVELLVSLHYIPEINLQTIEEAGKVKTDKKILYKVGVAGFIFGNVMLYALPEYLNGKPLDETLGRFLSILSFLLTIPLVFYSGSDYFQSAFKNLRKGNVNIDLPIALGIFTLFVVTAYEILSQTGPGYSDSLSGFLFFLLLGRWYQSRTYQSLSFERNYKSYFPVAVTRLNGGKEENTLLQDVKVDDILLIRSNELIPADAVLVEGTALIDYSFVTGESIPVKKENGDFVYAGGVQTSGSIKIKINKKVEQSHLTQLWNQHKNEQTEKKDLKSIIDRISVYFTITIILIALAGFAYWLINSDLRAAVLVFTSVLIVACPCALALSLPFTFGNTMSQLGANGMYIKNTSTIEKITQTNTIVFDKTGTLTRPDQSKIEFHGNGLSDEEIQMIVSLTKQSVHPLDYAISRYYKDIDVLPVKGFIAMSGKGIYGEIENNKISLGSKDFIALEKTDKTEGSNVYLKINNEVKGYFTIQNQYRSGFDKVLQQLGEEYDLFLLSGDNNTEQARLNAYFNTSQLHFKQSPQDKMNFIQKLQNESKTVLMTGDGLNDAGAFMQSDIALSIADDIYHFSPASDAIIDASKFHLLGRFIAFSKKALQIVKINFAISFLYNIVGLSIALSGNLSPVVAAILMPISSITVVAFATFAVKISAKSLLEKKA